MQLKNKGIGQKAIFGIGFILLIVAGSLIRKSVVLSGDTGRIKHVNTIATSIRAQSLGKDDLDKFYYPTHFDLYESLLKGNFDIPDPYGNICYFIGTVQSPHNNSSDFIVLTWGTTQSTLNPNASGVLFETSSERLKKIIKHLSPTIDKTHFQCEKTANIPWKKDMSPLLQMRVFPARWLKINNDQQICLGISNEELPADLATCIPEEESN